MVTQRIETLVNGGDWACAHADDASLAQVCRELAEELSPQLADLAETIARMSEADRFEHATAQWMRLVAAVRNPRGSATAPS